MTFLQQTGRSPCNCNFETGGCLYSCGGFNTPTLASGVLIAHPYFPPPELKIER